MKRLRAGILALLMALSLTACGEQAATTSNTTNSSAVRSAVSGLKGAYDNEILTTQAVDQSKTVITVRVENGVSQMGTLEKTLEEKFPEVDFVLVHDGSINSVYSLRQSLAEGVACDLIFSRSLTTLDDVAGEYLLDLSSEKLIDQYYVNAINSCAVQDGKIYYLPGPSDVYGIVYDKTLFQQYGWEIPHSYSEFVELLNTIRAANITVKYTDKEGKAQSDTLVPLQPSVMYPDAFQILFNTYGYEAAFEGTENFRWLTDYQNGEGSLVGHLEPAVEKFQKLFEDGILSLKDWETEPGTRSRMMYTYHTTAMVIECQNALSYADTYAPAGESAHELGMMPFWTSDEAGSDYVYSIPSYYMAINKAAAEESSEKKELLLQVYEFLSSAEGQAALIGDSPQISSVRGVESQTSDFSEEIQSTISSGRVIGTFYLAAGEDSKQVEKQLRSTVPDMMNGKMSVEEWLLAGDEARDAFLAGDTAEQTVYGQTPKTLTRLESAYTMAEMYRDLTGADIGICYGGAWRYGTNGYFYQGDITDTSLGCVRPDKEGSAEEGNPYSFTIVTAKMTGAQVLDILNSKGLLDETTEGECHYYVAAGLEVEFDPWAEEGKRVLSCNLPDGSELDPASDYTVAYFYESLPESVATPNATLGESWLDSFLKWLDTQGGEIKTPDLTITLKYGEGT